MSIYKRILLKLSGEALAGDKGVGFSAETITTFAQEIIEAQNNGTQIAIVLGGGNIFRGIKGTGLGIDRVKGDYMGMLATVINALAMESQINSMGAKAKVLTSTFMEPYAERYTRERALSYLNQGYIVIFAGGTGNPFFTTDSAAALRAVEISAEILLKATNVKGVYSDDPKKNPQATFYPEISFTQVIEQQLRVMDLTAFTLCQENNMPIVVFNIFEKNNILKILRGEKVGTLIH